MTTAIDSSILLDVLLEDAKFMKSSFEAIKAFRKKGRLIVCDAVVAEISPVLPDGIKPKDFFNEVNIEYISTSYEASERAGELYKSYIQSGGKRVRVPADFLIGAHAMIHSDQLLTRDKGFFRKHFKELSVHEPK